MTRSEADKYLKRNWPKLLRNSSSRIIKRYAAVIKKNDVDFVIEIGYDNGYIETYEPHSISENINNEDLIFDNSNVNDSNKEIDHDSMEEESYTLYSLPKDIRNENILIDDQIIDDFEKGKLVFNNVKEINYQNENIFSESKFKYSHITAGMSVFSDQSNNESGTAGAFFNIEEDNNIYLLSNHHVLLSNSGNIGDKIVHPSKVDNNNSSNIIGEIIWKEDILSSKIMDAAIAKINYPVDIGEYTRCDQLQFSGIAEPKIGQHVRKCGKKTGLTCGRIRSINCVVNVSTTPNNYRIYENQILTTMMTIPGDSGSVLVNDDNMVVGLLFSGDESNVSFANNIKTIFQRIKETHSNFTFKKFI